MHLNLGMPADAAASHRHEFSSKHNATMSSENLGFHQTYLQPFRYLQQKLADFAGAVTFGEPLDNGDEEARTSGTATSGMVETLASDGDSTGGVSRRASIARKRTVYQLAHPVAKSHKRARRKPSMILQLRQVDVGRKAAVPMMEVFRTRNDASVLTRNLSKRSTSQKSGSRNGDLQQLVFLTCDGYDDTESTGETTEDEESDHRNCVASLVHSNTPSHESRAVLNIGAEQWTIAPMLNGGYEFSHINGAGMLNRARWVPKPVSERRSILGAKSTNGRASQEKQFRFVLLSPLGRKHPIIGAMDCEAIEVRDEFTALDAAASTAANTCSLTQLNSNELNNQNNPTDSSLTKRCIFETTERIRLLTLITGVWVSIAEGWTQYGKLSSTSTDLLATPPSLSPSKLKTTPSRTDLGGMRSTTPGSVASKSSPIFGGRRHRHALTVDSTPRVDKFYHLDAARSQQNSELSFTLTPSNLANSAPTPVALEHLAVSDVQHPSEHGLGLGINNGLCASSIRSESIVEVAEPPVSPASSSGFHELLGRLHIGGKREARRSSDVSGRHTREAQQRESPGGASAGHARKKSEGGKRSRRFGFRKSKGAG